MDISSLNMNEINLARIYQSEVPTMICGKKGKHSSLIIIRKSL